DSIAWRSHDCKDRYAYTAPVGRYRANAFGLKDMLGNVWEWTGDVYHDSYAGAPTNGGVWQGKGSYHVLRGGSWNSDPQNARAAVRSSNKATQRFSLFGLRLVRKLP
ncbi:MAG: formylglycine-generating enzyme family protein, partial [Gallionella sp.]|nr:formylglycine-generating enzyme family protein [Gallionella sp.]